MTNLRRFEPDNVAKVYRPHGAFAIPAKSAALHKSSVLHQPIKINMSTNQATLAQGGNDSTETVDRRRSPRQPFVATAWVSPEAGASGPDRKVMVCNLSLQGVGFASEKPFEIDAVHWIVVGHGMLRASSRIRIVSCRANQSGQYDCGAEIF